MKKYFLFFTAIFSQLVFSQQYLNDSLSAWLESIKTKYKLAGLSVTLIKNNTIFAVGSAGLADISRSLPITDSTMYRIASISKTVAATALMQLYEEGKFKLDDDVNSYIGFTLRNPYYPNDPITFKMILAHTSGIQDGSGYNGFLSATGSATPPPISSVLVPGGTYYTSDMWHNHKPGTYFTYTNMGFGVVGTLVEKISGERFDVYCRKHIFEPLGIDASFNISDITNINKVAVLYRVSGGQWVPQLDNYQGVPPSPRNYSNYVIGSNGSLFGPQGNLRISAKDLAKFMIARMNGGVYNGKRILNDSTAKLMNTPVWTYNGSNGDNYYGLFRCWGLGTHITTNASMGDIVVNGKTMAGHPGEAYGLISDAYCETKNNEFGIIFMTNGKNGSYAFGSTSAFYDVEESVFATAYNFIQNPPVNVQKDKSGIPINFQMKQNFPNPFNPVTTISYSVPVAKQSDQLPVTLQVFDIFGKEIVTLVNTIQQPGEYSVKFDASNVASGVYFYKLSIEKFSTTKKMMVIK